MPSKTLRSKTTVVVTRRRTHESRPTTAQRNALEGLRSGLEAIARERPDMLVEALISMMTGNRALAEQAISSLTRLLSDSGVAETTPAGVEGRPVPELPTVYRTLCTSALPSPFAAKVSMPKQVFTYGGWIADLGPRTGHPAYLSGGVVVDWEAYAALIVAVAGERGRTIGPASIRTISGEVAAALSEQLGGRVTRRTLGAAARRMTAPGDKRMTWSEASQSIRSSGLIATAEADHDDPLAAPADPQGVDGRRAAAIIARWHPPEPISYAAGTLGYSQSVYAQLKQRAAQADDTAAAVLGALRAAEPGLFPVSQRRRG